MKDEEIQKIINFLVSICNRSIDEVAECPALWNNTKAYSNLLTNNGIRSIIF